jgi:hypothetical protein
MLQSEQLDTVLVLAADDKVAAGLLIQRLPIEGEGNLAGQADSVEREAALGQSEDFSRVKVVKQRDMEMGPETQFGLRVVELGKNKHGEPVTSCVVEAREIEAPAKAKLKPTRKEAQAYEIIQDLISRGGHTPIGKDFPNGIRAVNRKQIEDALLFRGLIPEASARQGMSRIITNLVEKRLAVQLGDVVWLSA